MNLWQLTAANFTTNEHYAWLGDEESLAYILRECIGAVKWDVLQLFDLGPPLGEKELREWRFYSAPTPKPEKPEPSWQKDATGTWHYIGPSGVVCSATLIPEFDWCI